MAYIRKISRKKGIVYRVEVHQPDGTNASGSFRTKEEAQRWARGQEDAKHVQRHYGVVPVRMILDEFFEQWFQDYARYHHSPGWQITDRTMYRKFVQPLLGRRFIRDVQPLDVQKVLNEMVRQGMAESYANRLRQLLHKMFQEAVKTYRYLIFNPVTAVRPFKEVPKAVGYLSQDEATKLLTWADRQVLGVGLHLGLQAGLREGEIVGLKWDAVDFTHRSLNVRRKWEKKSGVLEEFAKGKKIRVLGLYPDGLFERLKAQREKFPNTEFVVSDGGMTTPMRLIRLLERGVRETAITRVTVHGLRHTFASLYMQNGGDLYDLQKLMGHQAVSTTERYRHTDPEYLKKRCQVLNLYADFAQTSPTSESTALRLVPVGLVTL